MEQTAESTIHLINDMPDQLDMMAFMLRRTGYQVATALDGLKGLEIARGRIPDLIISDVSMPGMDGIELCRRIRADDKLRAVPIMLVTALRKDTESVLEGLQAGADEYLEAPYEPMRLIAKVARLLERKRTEDELRQSEARLASAQYIAHVGSWDWDIQNNQVVWSDELYRIFDLPKGSLENNPELIRNYIRLEDIHRVLSDVNDDFTQSAPYNLENRFTRPDGEIRFFHSIGEVTFDETGTPLRANGTIQDITERKRIEESLQASEKLYRLIIETANEGIWLIDLEGKIQFINPQAAELLGYTVEEMKGRNAFDFLFPADQDEAQRRFAERKKGYREQSEFRARCKDGSVLHILTSTAHVRDENGVITGVLGMLKDITEQKRVEQESASLGREMEAQQERLKSIVANVPGVVWETWWTPQCPSQKMGFVSNYVETMLGYSVEEWLSQPDFWLSVIHEEDRERARIESAKIISDGVSGRLEYRMERKDGSIVWAETQFVVIKEEGQPVGLQGVTIDVSERKQTEAALKKSENNYRILVESSPAIVYLSKPDPPYAPIYVSPNIATLGYPPEEWFSRPDIWISLIHHEDRDRVLRATQEAMSQDLDFSMEYRIITRDGQIRWIHVNGCFIFDQKGNKTAWQGVMLDITQTKGLEEQLRQAQKLESVGLLAGGIAHDFNNMLTAINGYSELTLRRMDAADPLRSNLEEIKKAGKRSASLTYQLLAFSRQQLLQPKIISLNQIITDTAKLLERLIGENIQLFTLLNQKAGQVEVDPGQLSQIIMNLAVNARDAMAQGGKLTFETDNVTLDEDYAQQHVGTLPGEFVRMCVSDTGTGMDAETKKHLFEPFFTTKAVGQGTGLGLATVYGIVKQSGGHIWVYSEEGVGTTFKVYFPRVGEQPGATETKNISKELPKGTETILLVEDEEMVRNLTRQILEMCGYKVLEARNGAEALLICEKDNCQIALLMTDVVMPQMGGRELAERLGPNYPQMRVLFTSGYTDDAIVRHGVIEAGADFIQKPFTPSALAQKVRGVLDNREEK